MTFSFTQDSPPGLPLAIHSPASPHGGWATKKAIRDLRTSVVRELYALTSMSDQTGFTFRSTPPNSSSRRLCKSIVYVTH